MNRLYLGRVPVDRVTFGEALAAIEAMITERRGGMVFTPNVDHVVLASFDERLQKAYEGVDLSLADGVPVVWASHLLGLPVPEKISGSDLAPRLLALAAARRWRVFLLGGDATAAQQASARLRRDLPELNIVGVASPRVCMDEARVTREPLLRQIRSRNPDLVLVGLGAPKQELFIHEAVDALRPAVLLGVGATIDFLAGTAQRAPSWVSSAGLEWLYRLAREPRRLWRRYLLRDWKFAPILMRELSTRWLTLPASGEARP
jgi:N-acetylglucosaminyldiphosphoundecaprenol N-acetyl-beta-D-mannosaminyltransferase